MLPNIECVFSAKSFSLGNISSLTSFQKLCTVCKDGQLCGSEATFRRPHLADR